MHDGHGWWGGWVGTDGPPQVVHSGVEYLGMRA